MNITVPQVLPVYISLVYLLIDKKIKCLLIATSFSKHVLFCAL